ncbi:hypothetical protein MIND_00847000 [Mycena indigotica]|uniref:Uncharacterized protein n=1 Tax=Mycena indigotica TaxID=2126181 RepID=A0A8H6SHD2_9AGAR|nr:uncharacterized protein MIND_00847000 [Mycena indigotica]KAF7298988.1 hypothetical protein MIND_00847000 [Mycena indigotica]
MSLISLASILRRWRWIWVLFRRQFWRLASVVGLTSISTPSSKIDGLAGNKGKYQLWVARSEMPVTMAASVQAERGNTPDLVGSSSGYSTVHCAPSRSDSSHSSVTVSTPYQLQRPDSSVAVIAPILPEQFARYRLRQTIPQEKTELEQHLSIQPETFDLSIDHIDPIGWTAILHPEGARYFHHQDRRIFTDADIGRPENLRNIERVVELVVEVIRDSGTDPGPYAALLGEGPIRNDRLVDLVIDIDPFEKKPGTGFYYFIDHSHQTPFWIQPFQAEELEIWDQIRGPISKPHLRHAMESQYWQHCIMFPSGFTVCEEGIRQLKDLLAFSLTDMTVSSTSTITASVDELRHWMAVAKNMQIGGLGSATSYAKIMDSFAQTKFLNFYGLPCARLNQDQSVYATPSRPSRLFGLASLLLFFAPGPYLEALEKAYIDDLVIARLWQPFINKLNIQWQDFILIDTVILAANVAFLSIDSVDSLTPSGHHTMVQTLSYVSTLASAGSIMIGFLLVRQNRTKFHDTAAAISASVHRRTSKRFGLEPLAVIFALPYSLAIWSMLAFFGAVLVTCTDTNDAARTITSVIAGVVGILVLCFLCFFLGIEQSSAPDEETGGSSLMNLWRVIHRLLPGQGHQDEYELLPETSSAHHDSRPRGRRRPYSTYTRWFTLRRLAILIIVMPFLLVFGVLLSGVPPTYSDIRAFEAALPQHNVSILSGVDPPLYLRFPGHLWGHGLNNVLQEAIVMGYVAHRSNRVYVFEDYTWSHLPLPYTIYDFALRSTRIPLNAFIVGPLAGGALPPPNELAAPKRAVSAAFYEQVCPRSVVHTVSAMGAPTEAEGSALVEWWVKQLSDVQGVRCVEIDSTEQPVFDRFLFGSPRVLSLLPGLYASPILGAFAWSPLVHSAVARNFAVLRPTDPAALYPPLRSLTLSSTPSDSDIKHVLAGLVAVHLRRGDYKRHCHRLAQWGSGYMGVNTHPALPDRFVIPSLAGPGSNGTATSKEIEAHYLEHCLPSPQQLAKRLHEIRAEHAARHPERPPLQRVYILTNAWGWFVNSVRSELITDGWREIWASGDITLDPAQAGVGMAVDMRIAEGAEVFLGNGFSSLTSNIVMLRLARGLEAASSRFL